MYSYPSCCCLFWRWWPKCWGCCWWYWAEYHRRRYDVIEWTQQFWRYLRDWTFSSLNIFDIKWMNDLLLALAQVRFRIGVLIFLSFFFEIDSLHVSICVSLTLTLTPSISKLMECLWITSWSPTQNTLALDRTWHGTGGRRPGIVRTNFCKQKFIFLAEVSEIIGALVSPG